MLKVLLWVPLLIAIINIVRLFRNNLTFRAKIFVAILMLVSGLIPFITRIINKKESEHFNLVIKELSNYVNLTENGFHAIGGMRNPTAFSDVLQSSIKFDCEKDGNIIRNCSLHTECGDSYMEKYKNLVQGFPGFPFSYLALSYCYFGESPDLAKSYALKGLELSKQMVEFPNHNVSHDLAKESFERILQKIQERDR